jgi:tRNA-specific 2-thiouridylase
MGQRVLVAMSGGVDSSVAAWMAREKGLEPVGLFMRTGVSKPLGGADRKKGCCSAEDAADARRVADMLDIPFYAIDFEADFRGIIDYFADEYLRGRTPNPCVVCNNKLKFGELFTFADGIGARHVVTGHYARVEPGPDGRPWLRRGLDAGKDQSYVLHGLGREALERVLFPLGGMPKDEVRETARRIGLPVFDKPDSVEICFVPDQDHVGLVRKLRPGQSVAGNIVTTDGEVVGRHDGLERFTIGQRKGLGLGGGKPRFVLEMVPETGEVVVGDKDELAATGLLASGFNWLIDEPSGELACAAQIRYRHAPVPATARKAHGGVEVRFDNPQPGVAPGQAVVLYEGDRVLGGGWIDQPAY